MFICPAFAITDVQHVPVRLQDLHKYGVRGQRESVHVLAEPLAHRASDPVVDRASLVGVSVHARRGRGAQGPEVREHIADERLQLADSRLRVRPVRGPGPESERGDRLRHGGVLVPGIVGRHAALQPNGRRRVGHWYRAVHDGQQRGTVPGEAQREHVQEAGELRVAVYRSIVVHPSIFIDPQTESFENRDR